VGLEWVWGLLQPGFIRWAPPASQNHFNHCPPVCKLWTSFFATSMKYGRVVAPHIVYHSHAVLPRRSQIIKGKLTFSPASGGIAKCTIVVVNSKRVVLFILTHKYWKSANYTFCIKSTNSTPKTHDQFNRSTRLFTDPSTQLDSIVKRSTWSIDSIDFGVWHRAYSYKMNLKQCIKLTSFFD